MGLLTDIDELDDQAGKYILLMLAEFLIKGDDKPLETLEALVTVYKKTN